MIKLQVLKGRDLHSSSFTEKGDRYYLCNFLLKLYLHSDLLHYQVKKSIAEAI